MARRPTNSEFLSKLKELSGIRTQTEFARVCGKKVGNMNQYLNGNFVPGNKVLKSCLESYARKSSTPPSFQKEIELREIEGYSPPKKPGVYVILDSGAKVLYIGQATNFSVQVNVSLNRKVPVGIRVGDKLKKVRPAIRDMAKYISLYTVHDKALRSNVEALLTRISINSTHNSNIGNFR